MIQLIASCSGEGWNGIEREGMGQGTARDETRGPSGAACGGRMGGRLVGTTWRQSIAAILALLAALLVCCAPASALSQRGHEYSTFIAPGASPAFKPSAIAASERTGDIYVLESANNRVSVFGPAPAHEFIETWGFGVNDGKTKYETCTKEWKECLLGLGGLKGEQLDHPLAIAVDNSSEERSGSDGTIAESGGKKVIYESNSAKFKLEDKGWTITGAKLKAGTTIAAVKSPTRVELSQEAEATGSSLKWTVAEPSIGDVYVVTNGTREAGSIDKFSANGEFIDRLISGEEAKEEAEGPIDGVAVDPSGILWAEREDGESLFVLQRYGDQVKGKLLGEKVEEEFSKEVVKQSVEFEVPEEISEEQHRPIRPGFAVDGAGNAYITYEPNGKDLEEREEASEEGTEQECEAKPCLAVKLKVAGAESKLLSEAEPLAELGRENTTGLGVDLSSEHETSGDVYRDNGTSVEAYTSGGSLIQRFGGEQLEAGGAQGLAVDAGSDEILVADPTTARVDIFHHTEPGKPVVKPESLAAANVEPSSAKLKAAIDPTGLDTHYRFLYGTGSCKAEECASEAPAAPGTDIGSGWVDQPAAAELTGLSPSTTYHFVVVAENADAENGERVLSEQEGTFK